MTSPALESLRRIFRPLYIDLIRRYRETSGAIETVITATAIPAARYINFIMQITSWRCVVYLDAPKCIPAGDAALSTDAP